MAIRDLLFTGSRRGFSLPSTSAVLSSSRFFLMEKLQCRAFQRCQRASLPWFTGSAINKYESIKFRKIGISSFKTNSHPNVVRLNATREFSRLRVFDDALQLSLRSGILNVVRPLNLFNSGAREAGIGWRGDLARRCFSQASRDVIGNKPPAKPFWKHRKHPKLLVALSKKSDATAVEGTDKVTLEEQLVEDNKVVDLTKKAKEKDRKRPLSKKSKKQDVNTVSSPDVAPKSGTKDASQGKKSKNTKGASLTVPKKKATESTPVDASNDSAPKKSKKPSKDSKGNLASVKEGKVLKKTKVASSNGRLPKISALGNGSGRKPEKKKAKQLYPPIGKSVMVVESATKAKVIQGYLGDLFEVMPSYGHVRDLAARSGSVRPDEDFSMVWEVPSPAWTHLKSIKVALNGAENLILASDPDREGEAIAWHILEMLEQQDALHENVSVSRVVFHEITETSIKAALQTPREIDANLVHAYLARRALDYLIGFNISPLLWRKLPGCQSAGRVQSAALSLICDREMEIDKFKPQEYWTVDAAFLKGKSSSSTSNLSFMSELTQFDSKKLSQLSIGSHEEAKVIEQLVNSSVFKIVNTKRNQLRKNPPAPYITSTLQQDAANRLHFSAAYTMKLAQKLYEGIQLADGQVAGLITYIRTDGLHISDVAVADIRSLVTERYGQGFASDGARKYFKKLKNAQEAHESIRPTDIRRLPSNLAGTLDEDSLKLYTLIWSRSMSCQMEPAIFEQIHVDIGSAEGSTTFRSSCSRVGFPGYQVVYQDLESDAIKKKEIENDEHDEAFNLLSSLKTGDPLYLGEVNLKQHHTQPPSRYSEGSLVKKLEELGIGRPSTYASTLKVLQERKYVTVESRVLHPEFRGRMVSAFLSHHFSEVTDYCFTADMETELDNVSAGLTEWKGLLKDYWTRFSSYCSRASNVHIHQVEKMLEKTFGDFLFASLPDKNRTCPSCLEGTLIFKVSRYGEGYFIGCDQHPKCKYIAKTIYGDDDDVDTPSTSGSVEEPKIIGLNPGSNEKVLLKNGPYGFYVQLGEDRKGHLPKRASVSQLKDVNSITLEDALDLLRYPVTLGNHPDDGQPVILKIARVGFSIRHRSTMATVPKNVKPSDVTLEKALKLLSSKDVRHCGRPKKK